MKPLPIKRNKSENIKANCHPIQKSAPPMDSKVPFLEVNQNYLDLFKNEVVSDEMKGKKSVSLRHNKLESIITLPLKTKQKMNIKHS